MKTENFAIIRLLLLGTITALVLLIFSCQKEHAEYRFKPKFNIGELVQFEKSIEHDYAEPGKRMWDIPQPFTVDSFYYNPTWRDNWYYVTDATGKKYGSAIDELSLQRWNGKLQK